ncbi:universal stress protein [Hydrogenovibrio kuenenii]|uniref:universal stress protein n=1 Tax=Hydrogenovibrio kuenenii TaxID=63658 RepID=UPI000463286C|nr:universal stress protein [Hydrogenovibrio kuenenii]
MRVVSLVNGSLLSEAASFYAIAYAKSVKLPLSFLFIDNGKESLERLESSIATLQEIAEAHDVETEAVILEGGVLSQLQHYAKLYSIDTLFCATRKLSNSHSFSDTIVKAGLETDIAVVKVKNVSQVRSYRRSLLVSGVHINPHAYLLWLGLLIGNEASGKLYLQNSHSAKHASTKSGFKYESAPFMQIANMLNQDVDVVQVLQPMSTERINNYLVENDFDLAVYNASDYSKKLLDEVTDESSTNSILFYPWMI